MCKSHPSLSPSEDCNGDLRSLEGHGNAESSLQLSYWRQALGRVWPLPPIVAIALIPLIPSYLYLNRGFTVWFHWVSMAYWLTQSKYLRRFQVLIGCSICLGWYAAIAHDYIRYGQFCHTLYRNMPAFLTDAIWDDETMSLRTTTRAKMAMVVAHVLDFIGHPLLTLYFWRQHSMRGGTMHEILTSWPVILGSYAFSRLWSLVHVFHNHGRLGLFYMGFDVYLIDNLAAWYPAYIAESVVFVCVLSYKLLHDSEHKSAGNNLADRSDDRLVPSPIRRDSCT